MEHEPRCHHPEPEEKRSCCAHGQNGGRKKVSRTLVVAVVLAAAVALSYVVPFLAPFRMSLYMHVGAIWWAILLGLVLGGVIDYFIPREYVTRHLARDGGKGNILCAVVLGFFMSVCSHGVLALAIQLHKKGASTPAVIAFLMASPWANLPLTIMLIGFFGVAGGIYIIMVAIIVALTTGFTYHFLEARGLVEKNTNTFALDANFSVRKDLARRWRERRWDAKELKKSLKGIWAGTLSLSDMVLWWILIGIGFASLAGAYVPPEFFYTYMGPSVLGLSITLALATVLEVCSEGTAPLAFEIFRQTGALGNSFVFLMAGVATDYTEIGLLWHNVGRRAAVWLPIVTVPQIILFGVLANMIF